MKKISILVVLIFLISVISVNASIYKPNNEVFEIYESIGFSKPKIIEQNLYLKIELDDITSYFNKAGNPKLPLYTKTFTFPMGTKITDVQCYFSFEEEISLQKKIIPVSEPKPISNKDFADENDILIENKDVYLSTNFYPINRFEYNIGSGLDENNHVIIVTLMYYPIIYSPQNDIIYYTDEVTFKINYETSKSNRFLADEFDLVIISPEEFSESIQPLIDHKNSMGVSTFFKTTEEIYGYYPGRDQAEEIKYFIKDALESYGNEYVLVVGSVYKFPMRLSETSLWHFESQTLTDLYYSDIYDGYGEFSSWDTNNNNLFGEEEDDVDLYPDVHIGRLPCDSVDELDIIIDKIIKYETETYGQDWFNNMIFIGGNTFPYFFSSGNEGEENNLIIKEIMSDFTPTIIWTSKRNFNKITINNAINNGAGFVDYSGHGFENGIGTYPPYSKRMKYYLGKYIDDLENGYKLPIIFFDACLTAKLDYVLQDLLDYKAYRIFDILARILDIDTNIPLPVFAYYFLKHPNGGAIATIGATRTAYGGIDDGAGKMSIEFFSAYNSSDMLGEMMTQAQTEYINDVPYDSFTVVEFTLLGDPSLKIGGYQ